jgi:hypothetical protein
VPSGATNLSYLVESLKVRAFKIPNGGRFLPLTTFAEPLQQSSYTRNYDKQAFAAFNPTWITR